MSTMGPASYQEAKAAMLASALPQLPSGLQLANKRSAQKLAITVLCVGGGLGLAIADRRLHRNAGESRAHGASDSLWVAKHLVQLRRPGPITSPQSAIDYIPKYQRPTTKLPLPSASWRCPSAPMTAETWPSTRPAP